MISQSQSSDEFWYTCVPNNVAGPLENCGNTAFRETEVTIDGKPAGVAPVYPWIYTGGIDPYLWEPLVGIETLNFKPYRVDLTPFAGVLSDGNPHTVAVSVYNADSGFDEASNLLLYTDPNAATVTGGLTADTLTPEPMPNVEQYLNTAADGTISGPVYVSSNRAWKISGYVITSQGRVDTTIEATNSFLNSQDEKVLTNAPTVAGVIYKQNIAQDTRAAGAGDDDLAPGHHTDAARHQLSAHRELQRVSERQQRWRLLRGQLCPAAKDRAATLAAGRQQPQPGGNGREGGDQRHAALQRRGQPGEP